MGNLKSENELLKGSFLRCPVCGAPLSLQDTMYGCENGHPFNIAKEGYINLLLSHQRKSKNPGDDPEMVMARRRFFDSGAYDRLTDIVLKSPVFQAVEKVSVLDSGCGEGHILGALSEKLNGCFCGVDISKKAVQVAAKRHKKATWIVANGMREIPISDDSMDVILSILAPRNNEEFCRILKSDGVLILGVPGPNHLIELRNQLQFTSGDFKEKADEAAAKCAPQFVETNREHVSYEAVLRKEQIADLIRMTPLFWRSSDDAKEDVMELDQLTVTVSFTLLTLKPAL
ncbi:methyltransferase domain-containing protein [Pontiellaceae bacterium B12219]|nr:methyltransferase domain-containing protein [Pontiellaceae bacterium B12219]